MTSTSHFPFLTVLVLTPAVGAAVVALIPPKAVAKRFHEAIGALVGLFVLILSLVIVGQCKVGDGGYQLVSDHVWAKELGIHWSLGVDGISLFLVVMTALLFPLTMGAIIVYAKASEERPQRNICRVCGYDLRASPIRCPECGTPVHHDPERF